MMISLPSVWLEILSPRACRLHYVPTLKDEVIARTHALPQTTFLLSCKSKQDLGTLNRLYITQVLIKRRKTLIDPHSSLDALIYDA